MAHKQLQSLFYAVFDNRLGPQLVHQGGYEDYIDNDYKSNPNHSSSSATNAAAAASNNNNTNTSMFNSNSHSALSGSAITSSFSIFSTASSNMSNSSSYQSYQNKMNEAKKKKYLTTDEFDKISDHIIARPELCGSVFTTFVFGMGKIIVSFPLYVENDGRYERSKLMFSFGACIASDNDLGAFHQLIKKLGNTFKSMEIESCFLSNKETCSQLDWILKRIVRDIVDNGECLITIPIVPNSLAKNTGSNNNIDQQGSSSDAGSNILSPTSTSSASSVTVQPLPTVITSETIALKLMSKVLDPPDILDHQVPVPTRNLEEIITKETDLTVRQVSKYIDGRRFVKQIAIDSRIDVFLVRRCCRQLLYYRCVVMCDIVQYSNLYTCTTKIQVLARDKSMQKACTEFITKKGYPPTPYHYAFKLYASMHCSITYGEFCIQFNTRGFGIDEEKFILFGVANGLLRRVHKFPVVEKLSPFAQDSNDNSSEATFSPMIKDQSIEPPSLSFGNENEEKGNDGSLLSKKPGKQSTAFVSPPTKPFDLSPKPTLAESIARLPSNNTAISYQTSQTTTSTAISNTKGFGVGEPSPSGFSIATLQSPSQVNEKAQETMAKVIKLADGSHSIDAICVELTMGAQELLMMLESSPKHTSSIVTR